MAVGFKRRSGGNGGFLNGVTGRIDAITFKANSTGKTKKGGDWTTYSGVVTVTPDGGEAVEQYLDAGFLYGDNKISKDGRTIEGNDLYTLDSETQFGRFIFSLVEGRDTGNFLTEDALGDGRNYDGVAGARVTFARVLDVEGTKARGARILGANKAKNATDEQLIEAGKRKVKKGKSEGKSFMLDNLLVSDVVAGPEPTKGGKKQKAAKPAATAAPAAAPAADMTEQADAALKAILGAADNATLGADKLSNKFLRYAVNAGIGRDQMEPLRQFLVGDDYLKSAEDRELIVIKGEGKAREIVLTAE